MPKTGSKEVKSRKLKKVEIHSGIHTLTRTWVQKLKKLGRKIRGTGPEKLVSLQTAYHGVTLTLTLHPTINLESYSHLVPETLVSEITVSSDQKVCNEQKHREKEMAWFAEIQKQEANATCRESDLELLQMLQNMTVDDAFDSEPLYSPFSDESDPYTDQLDQVLDTMEMELCGLLPSGSSAEDTIVTTSDQSSASERSRQTAQHHSSRSNFHPRYNYTHNDHRSYIDPHSKLPRIPECSVDESEQVSPDDGFTDGMTRDSENASADNIPVMQLSASGTTTHQDSLKRPHKLRIHRKAPPTKMSQLVYNIV